MDILITDVTEMHQGNYCVAGWDSATQRMVRPLPNGSNWTSGLLNTHSIVPGNTIRFVVTNQPVNSTYPHRTEDTPIDPTRCAIVNVGPAPWFGVNSPPCSQTLNSAFERKITTTGEWNGALKGAYVPEGVLIGSLSAVRVGAEDLAFFENDYKGTLSLRAYLTDSNGRYNLAVVAKALRDIYRIGGVANLNEVLTGTNDIHVRVGLARAWNGQRGKCTVMINGVYR